MFCGKKPDFNALYVSHILPVFSEQPTQTDVSPLLYVLHVTKYFLCFIIIILNICKKYQHEGIIADIE